MPLNKDQILNKKQNMFDTSVIQRGIKEGIEIEKGVVLNEEYMTKHMKEIGDIYSLFSAYPDIFLSLITPADSNFSLFFYQRMTLRALMRYKDVYITAPRALI